MGLFEQPPFLLALEDIGKLAPQRCFALKRANVLKLRNISVFVSDWAYLHVKGFDMLEKLFSITDTRTDC
jgi:hypothetical protein